MTHWNSTLRLRRGSVKLLVTEEQGDDLLKAVLPLPPRHPRALLTLLEGLALWAGAPLPGAISVEPSAPDSCVSALFDGELWAPGSALVTLDFVHQARRSRRIRGLGEFREVRRVHGLRGSQ